MAKEKSEKTHLMLQYERIKAQYPDAILLFRMGDFYETFGEDAIKTSSILGITLTRRGNGAAKMVELAGFPYHALDAYLPSLVRAGERVAICEQLEDPQKAKDERRSVVERGVTELITPGVVPGEHILEQKENTYLAAIHFGPKTTGVAFLDLSTGEFYAAEGPDTYIDKLLSNFQPKEILFARGSEDRFSEAFHGSRYYTYRIDGWQFSEATGREKLCKQFGATSLKGFGIEQFTSGISAAGAILGYIEFTKHLQIGHIRSIARIDQEDSVWIDRFTMRNLELFALPGIRSLSEVLDRTLTPMGSRLLKRWIALPSRDIATIEERLNTVEYFIQHPEFADILTDKIHLIGDLERLASRIATGRIRPREMRQLHDSLIAIGELKTLFEQSGEKQLAKIARQLNPLEKIRKRIYDETYPDPEANQIQKGGVIRNGVDAHLDDYRNIARNGKEVLKTLCERQSEALGIPLKITHNNLFGYYIEVRNTHQEKFVRPAEWTHKQTLTDAVRYTCPELQEYEKKIVNAEENILAIELRVWGELLAFIARSLTALQRNAAVVARIDCLQSFARQAIDRGYVRPTLDKGTRLDIRQGRHPVIETLMPVGEPYIPNDVALDDREQQIIMITGPNMSGKSALLRQTALICLMAQIGSFVPAEAAHIGLVDKIFTRVGASDNLSQGESTFMVEMLESASILNNVSNRSLVLLDEIGRGTSTYDGISIAWAMVEYLHNHPTARARTLFATHYHELNEMERVHPRVHNYHVSVRKVENTIVFLRKLERGGTEHSFGIHVARMAGMPTSVVERAEEILENLEQVYGTNQIVPGKSPRRAASSRGGGSASAGTGSIQLQMFQLDDPVLIQVRDQIKDIDINSLTPIEALNKLNEIKKISGL